MEGVRVSIYLDTRRKKANGEYPVKIRVYYQEERKLYPTVFDLTESQFKQSYMSLKPKKEYKQLKLEIQAIENKANDIVKDFTTFSFEQFEKKMFRATGEQNNAIYHYDQYINKLIKENRIGTAGNYKSSKKSILAFYNKDRKINSDKLSFDQITPAFLTHYENWMLDEGKQPTTVGIYIRPLRTIFNNAIAEGDINIDVYPFGKRKYQIPAGQKTKKALNKEELKAFYNYPIQDHPQQEKARDFWFLSYQCNGMNIKDIAQLKYENIEPDVIVFNRAKTRNTSKTNSKPIIVSLTNNIRELIDKYGIEKQSPKGYVFSIINTNMTEEQKHSAIQNFTRFINQHVKKIAKLAGIRTDISTYWARHSYVTSAIRNGATMEYISESVGHSELRTTETYFGGFEDNVKKEIAEKLMQF